MPASANTGIEAGFGTPCTVPAYTDRIPDRIANFCHVLKRNPHIYRKFKVLAVEYQRRNPGRPFSSELIVSVMRFHSSVRVDGDQYAINANLKPLLSRLYLIENPDAPIEKRNSWLDHLSPAEWQQILGAWQR
jgi:hypothetical protein